MAAKAIKRLNTELKAILQTPPPLADARPDENSILTWHFVLDGAPGTPYEGGEYLGQLIFPEQYPFKPPTIKMTTPSGRFKTHTRLCFSMSDFHPEEWSPMWGVSQILTGLNSFMNEDASTHGSINTSDAVKRDLAKQTHAFNVCLPEYKTLFPQRYESAQRRIAEEKAAAERRSSAASSGSGLFGRSTAASSDAAAVGLLAGATLRLSRFVMSWRGLMFSASVSLLAAAWAAQHGWLTTVTTSSATTAASLSL